MESLSLTRGNPHTIRRSELLHDVISLYEKEQLVVLEEHPFRVTFFGEKAMDVRGVTRDVFCVL